MTRINLDIEEESRFRKEGSWGATEWESGTLRITAWVNTERGRGGFEIYDMETRGNRAYGEGGMWFDENGFLCDYDGVGMLDLRIVEWLDSERLIDTDPKDYFRKRIVEAAEKRGDA